MLEDALWTRIRLLPDDLPVGEFRMIPGGFSGRTLHQRAAPEKAVGKLEDDGGLKTYTVEYPASNRTLRITFEAEFPHRIESWEETARGLTTKATRRKELLTDYWNHNGKDDRPMRRELGLPED